MNLKKDTFDILSHAVNAVKPAHLIPNRILFKNDILHIDTSAYNLNDYGDIYVIGAGKASAAMAFEFETLLGSRIKAGCVITNYGSSTQCSTIKIFEAGHPLPDANGLKATSQIIKLLGRPNADDLVLCLISGGASALLENPAGEIELTDLVKLNGLLLDSGADIKEINCVRKHISKVKGGQLARIIQPAKAISIILSDVIGDPLDSIASGPTVADPTTFNEAWAIISKYKLHNSIPFAIKNYLQAGLEKKVPETLKAKDAISLNINNHVIGNNDFAQNAAAEKAQKRGYQVVRVPYHVVGEARLAALKVVDFILAQKNYTATAIIWGGETTVTKTGTGRGGRNQEFVLAALQKLVGKSFKSFTLASIGTDGIDGPTDAAGAFIDNQVLKKVAAQNLIIKDYLNNNDSYTFFDNIDSLIRTGPSGTNVADIGCCLIAKD